MQKDKKWIAECVAQKKKLAEEIAAWKQKEADGQTKKEQKIVEHQTIEKRVSNYEFQKKFRQETIARVESEFLEHQNSLLTQNQQLEEWKKKLS